MCVIVRSAGESICLVVDEIVDVLEQAPDSFEPAPDVVPARLRRMTHGVFKLERELLAVLDIDKVVETGLDPI
jgi:purine-binding chemotaxis protein CheW